LSFPVFGNDRVGVLTDADIKFVPRLKPPPCLSKERRDKDGAPLEVGDVHQSQHSAALPSYPRPMPWSLKRYQEARCLHFITFSCYRRAPLLGTAEAHRVFEQTLERVRQWYGFYVTGYVLMPEHVHLLISEPERGKLSVAIQMLKQNVARQLNEKPRPVAKTATRAGHARENPFWLARYYDFNVTSEEKVIEKLRYIHRNPVMRGLVGSPEDWESSSFRHYLSGVEGVVEIESHWTARKRVLFGATITLAPRVETPALSLQRTERQGRGTPRDISRRSR
jgi:putative transposase